MLFDYLTTRFNNVFENIIHRSLALPSFDIVSEVDLQEGHNAVDQANRELSTRYDFRGVTAEFIRQDKIYPDVAKTG